MCSSIYAVKGFGSKEQDQFQDYATGIANRATAIQLGLPIGAVDRERLDAPLLSPERHNQNPIKLWMRKLFANCCLYRP